jgi:hypothetical protein
MTEQEHMTILIALNSGINANSITWDDAEDAKAALDELIETAWMYEGLE